MKLMCIEYVAQGEVFINPDNGILYKRIQDDPEKTMAEARIRAQRVVSGGFNEPDIWSFQPGFKVVA